MQKKKIVGAFNDEGPPVPIPNTEVKLICAENTCLVTDREDRSVPTQASRNGSLFSFFFNFQDDGSQGNLFLPDFPRMVSFSFSDLLKSCRSLPAAFWFINC